MSEVYSAYPLQWPTGWKRTESYRRGPSRFGGRKNLSVIDGVERVLLELSRLQVSRDDIVISTNVPTRLDGLPRSDQAGPGDPGVAVYWRQKDKATRVMAADHYNRVADNLAAIAATLEALRAIERHGGAQILDRAFTGFTALPSSGSSSHWRDVLGVGNNTRIDVIESAYRELRSKHHPDKGGDAEKFNAVQRAYEDAKRELSQ